MVRLFALVSLLASLSAAAPGARAAEPPSSTDSHLQVYLLTMQPGDAVYERFGHNAIWIRDRATGQDTAYNYGVFHFEEENFILNFIKGRMWYWAEDAPAAPTVHFYSAIQGRTVWAQELNLSHDQRRQLRDFLKHNILPENRKYLYDYYRDNCSTRVRDALDRVLGGQLKQALSPRPTPFTYRDHTRRAMRVNPVMYVALHAVLGPRTDHPLSAWEESFLPEKLQAHLRTVTITDASGNQVPLVLSESVVGSGTKPLDPATVPNWLAAFLIAGLALAGLFILFSRLAPRRRWARVGFLFVTVFWTLLIGLGGSVIFMFWFTSHVAAHKNENLFHITPLALPLAILIPALVLRRRWAYKPALLLAAIVAASTLLGLLVQPLPWFNQVNGEIISLVLPANLALAWAVWSLTRTIPPRTADVPQTAPARAPSKARKES